MASKGAGEIEAARRTTDKSRSAAIDPPALYAVRRDQPRRTIHYLFRIPRQIEPLRRLHLRREQKDGQRGSSA